MGAAVVGAWLMARSQSWCNSTCRTISAHYPSIERFQGREQSNGWTILFRLWGSRSGRGLRRRSGPLRPWWSRQIPFVFSPPSHTRTRAPAAQQGASSQRVLLSSSAGASRFRPGRPPFKWTSIGRSPAKVGLGVVAGRLENQQGVSRARVGLGSQQADPTTNPTLGKPNPYPTDFPAFVGHFNKGTQAGLTSVVRKAGSSKTPSRDYRPEFTTANLN